MSLLLALDRSTVVASAALFRDGVFVRTAEAASRTRGDCDVAALAASALEGSGAGFADLGAFAVGLGPGSFSGVRSALAFLDGLAFPADAEVIGVASCAAIAWTHLRDTVPGSAAFVVGDARRDTLWLARYERAEGADATLRETDAPTAIPAPEALARFAADPDAAILSPDVDRLVSALATLPAERLCGSVSTMTLAEAVGALALDPASPRVVPPLPLYLHPAVRTA